MSLFIFSFLKTVVSDIHVKFQKYLKYPLKIHKIWDSYSRILPLYRRSFF